MRFTWKSLFTSRSQHLPAVSDSRHSFFITSSGQMGSFWLACQLNKHPDIFCTHAYNRPLSGATGSPLRGEAGEEQRKIIKQYLSTLSLSDFVNEHIAATAKPYTGNIHAYNIDQICELQKRDKNLRFSAVNLVRHPITRIHSAANCFHNEWFDFGYVDHMSFVPKSYLTHGRPLITQLFPNRVAEFDDSFHKQFFIVAAMGERGSAYHANIAKRHGYMNMKYEDITTSTSAMRQLMAYLFAEQDIDIDPWLAHDVSYKKINAHASQNDSVKTLLNNWEPWQIELYTHIINTDKNFRVYEGVYDLSI